MSASRAGSCVKTSSPDAEQLDPLLFRPRLQPGVVMSRLESRRHGPHFMLKSPGSGAYLRLGPREHELLGLMDGQRTITEIAVEAFYRHQSLALGQVTQLAEVLHREGFLVAESAVVVESAITPGAVRQPPSAPGRPAVRVGRLLARLFRSEITLSGTDAFVTRLWRSVGWLLLARPALALYGLVAVGGPAALLASHHLAEIRPVNLFAPRAMEMVLLIALFVPLLIFTHEMAHALVCKSFGRDVRRGGIALYFGIPAFFVDTTDIWLESRARRIAVSAAGLVSDLTLGGACSLLALAVPAGAGAMLLFLASIAYFSFLLNLVPLLELDGYYILVDLLEMPMLRPRSLAFVREHLLGKLRRRERFDRQELLFAVYGLLAGLFSVLMFVYAVRLLEISLAGLLDAVASGGSWLLALLALLLLVRLGIPLVLRAASAIAHAVSLASRTLRMRQ